SAPPPPQSAPPTGPISDDRTPSAESVSSGEPWASCSPSSARYEVRGTRYEALRQAQGERMRRLGTRPARLSVVGCQLPVCRRALSRTSYFVLRTSTTRRARATASPAAAASAQSAL